MEPLIDWNYWDRVFLFLLAASIVVTVFHAVLMPRLLKILAGTKPKETAAPDEKRT